MVEAVGLARSTVSTHLGCLKDCGLGDSDPIGCASLFRLTHVAAESAHHLLGEHRARTTLIGIVLTALALVLMPLLGYSKHRLAARLSPAATAGEGTPKLFVRAPVRRGPDRPGDRRRLARWVGGSTR
ncbi:hypothetical protein AWC20_07790 [Mycobacterium parmense]|nr:hypothetical protein AWC20_07790 [Mycobacterium parmense]